MATISPRKQARPAPKKALRAPAPAKKTTVQKKASAPVARADIKTGQREVSLSPKGKVLGRPRLLREPLGQVQTRIPGGLSDYLKILALEKLPGQPAPFRTMQKMFETLFTRFIDERPWDHGLAWRESHAVARFSGGTITERTEWKQLNIQLPIALTQRVETTAERLGRSQSSFCYTALCWWAGMLYPPVSSQVRG